ncbi:MAG TPA: response regulator [Candidatus Acidoferrales bacterium]|nr:response regulator [Candidatus Acidoferrales bacterium]
MRKGLKILVVDDEAIIRDAMKQLLEHCGCEVEACDCGSAALARVAQYRFDVVITDFSMPGMQGDQLVAHIRKVAPSQRIIMATAYVEEYKVFGQPSASVDGLLFKPFTFRELQDAIEAVLARETPAELQAISPLADTMPAEKENSVPPPEPM